MTPKQYNLLAILARFFGIALMFISVFRQTDNILTSCVGLMMFLDGLLIKKMLARDEK